MKSVNAMLTNLLVHARARVKEAFGAAQHYGIRGAYRHRATTSYFDDTAFTDEWQREVYQRAADLMRDEGLTTVCDLGCGAGYKLIHYLGDYETIGYDVPETVAFLKNKYPDRRWETSDISAHNIGAKYDLVICADVIEHVENPIALLSFAIARSRKRIVLSTPDRDLVYPRFSPHHLGPPANPSHVREWSFAEFARFVDTYIDVLEHTISNREQATQMIVGTVR